MSESIRSASLAILAMLCAACSAPARETTSSDTPHLRQARATDSSPRPVPSAVRANPDTASFTLRVLVGLTRGSHSPPAELLLRVPSGQRTGWDGASRVYLMQIPGARYDSTAYDDDEPPVAGAAPAVAGISNREIELEPRESRVAYALDVIGLTEGAYALQLDLQGRASDVAVRREAIGVPLQRGAVHRYVIRRDAGTLTLERAP